MCHVRRTDHDLRGHAADIDAGAADGAALDDRHMGAKFRGLQCRSHGRAARADDSDTQTLLGIGGLGVAIAAGLEQTAQRV